MDKKTQDALRLQGINGEFGFMISKFFQENNVSNNEAMYILSSYLFSLSNQNLTTKEIEMSDNDN